MKFSLRAAALALAVAPALFSQVTTSTWTGTAGGTFSNFLTPGNWAGGTAPSSSGTNTALVFGATNHPFIFVGANIDANSLTFSTGYSSYYFLPNPETFRTLGIGSGGITLSGTSGNSVQFEGVVINLLANQAWNSAGFLAVYGDITGAFSL